jgi:phenylacetate-CoA ligase
MLYHPNSLLVKLYHASPVFLQNIFFSMAGYYNYQQRYNKHFFRALEFLKESEWWDKTKIRDYQEEKFNFIIRTAYANSPFVRSQFKKVNLRPTDINSVTDLGKIPICTKNDLRECGLTYYNQSIKAVQLIKGLTSGTSGRALEIFNTKETLSFQWAVWARHKERFGIRLGNKHLSFGARVPIDARQSNPPFWRWNSAGKQMYLSTFHLASKFLDSIVNFMNNEPFDYYLGYPSSMYVVAKYMEERGMHLMMRPKYIVTGSDALLPQFEKTIKHSFGVPVTEQYGMAEGCGNFSKCEYGKFHLDFEFGLAEFLPIKNSESQNRKRLVFTSLVNDAMPLIRYDIGDIVEIDDESCLCGRKSTTIRSIEGRMEDYIITPDGRKISGLNQVFEWADGIKEIQVYQKRPDKIEVRYIPAINFSSIDIDALEEEFRKRLGDEIKIDYQSVTSISRTASGKYKAVISDL